MTSTKMISATLTIPPSSPTFHDLYLRCRLKVLPSYHTKTAVEMQLIVADGGESTKVQSNLIPLKRNFHKHIGCHGKQFVLSVMQQYVVKLDEESHVESPLSGKIPCTCSN